MPEEIMPEELSRFDAWINDGGPSALIVKEYLEPAAGAREVIFPPTFAPPEGSKESASYIIDGEGSGNACLLDSVGSQANRLEPVFKTSRYCKLVPQVKISVKTAGSEGRVVNLLDVGHRAADAFMRSTELAAELEKGFRAFAEGNATPLAKIAPTTLIFGAWDSRATQVKIPRMVDSTVRAFNVQKLRRAAQYFSALEKDEVEELLQTDSLKQKKLLGRAGFLDAPSGTTHGGIIVDGAIVRTTILNLTSLRALGGTGNEEQLAVLRYVLGLALIVVLAPVELSLRQGCLLVRSSLKQLESKLVYRNGNRAEFAMKLADVESFAGIAAKQFGVGPDRNVDFKANAAKELVKKASKIKEETDGST